MIAARTFTAAERSVLRDALVTYCASLDRRLAGNRNELDRNNLSWRRYLADELLDTLRG